MQGTLDLFFDFIHLPQNNVKVICFRTDLESWMAFIDDPKGKIIIVKKIMYNFQSIK